MLPIPYSHLQSKVITPTYKKKKKKKKVITPCIFHAVKRSIGEQSGNNVMVLASILSSIHSTLVGWHSDREDPQKGKMIIPKSYFFSSSIIPFEK
jgi:hypothetical protein